MLGWCDHRGHSLPLQGLKTGKTGGKAARNLAFCALGWGALASAALVPILWLPGIGSMVRAADAPTWHQGRLPPCVLVTDRNPTFFAVPALRGCTGRLVVPENGQPSFFQRCHIAPLFPIQNCE
jgi:hypothetical protein